MEIKIYIYLIQFLIYALLVLSGISVYNEMGLTVGSLAIDCLLLIMLFGFRIIFKQLSE